MVSLDIEIKYTQTIDYNLAHPKCTGQKLIFLGEFSICAGGCKMMVQQWHA